MLLFRRRYCLGFVFNVRGIYFQLGTEQTSPKLVLSGILPRKYRHVTMIREFRYIRGQSGQQSSRCIAMSLTPARKFLKLLRVETWARIPCIFSREMEQNTINSHWSHVQRNWYLYSYTVQMHPTRFSPSLALLFLSLSLSLLMVGSFVIPVRTFCLLSAKGDQTKLRHLAEGLTGPAEGREGLPFSLCPYANFWVVSGTHWVSQDFFW